MPPASARDRGPVALAPEAFRVLRDRLDTVAGYYTVGEIDRLSHRLVEEDLLLARCWSTSGGTPFRAASASCSAGRGCRATTARRRRPSRPRAGSTSSGCTWRCGPPSGGSTRSSRTRDVRTDGGAAGIEFLPGDPIDLGGVPYYATRTTSVRRRSTAGSPGSSPPSWRSRTIRSWIRPASARPGRSAGRPDEARVRRHDLPPATAGPRCRASRVAARRLGLRGHAVEQRHRGERPLAPPEARRPGGSIETVRGLGYRFSVPDRPEADTRV